MPIIDSKAKCPDLIIEASGAPDMYLGSKRFNTHQVTYGYATEAKVFNIFSHMYIAHM